MPIAAVPAYLGSDFSSASPEQRFGMFLRLWGVDQSNRHSLWTTHDISYREAGPDRVLRSYKDENKSASLREATRLTPADKQLMAAFYVRQQAQAEPLQAAGQLLRLDAVAIAPFATGLGNEHPLENGFSFLNPYGLPYLPGSGVKGVLRRAAGELAGGLFGGTAGWTDEAIVALFGRQGDDDEGELQRGALGFWDVLPQIQGDALKVEVMTAHQGHYYMGTASPHESGSPIPINFLSVPPGSRFAFHVHCNAPFLRRLAPDLDADGRWQELVEAAFRHAYDWMGFGAKTAVGYGAMRIDGQALVEREERLAKARDLEQSQNRARHREAELAAMSPFDRKVAGVLQKKPADQPAENALLAAIDAGVFEAEERVAAARLVVAALKASKRWKESSEKKNPEKDKDYQLVLRVKRLLEGAA